ncbi:MAG: hypothetical protein GXP31_02595 [Kiritimatiellaeota bacterium]|nr:hypothetical protein [Kiritimatiellota bacterium]
MTPKIRVLVWTDAAGLCTPEHPIVYGEGIHVAVAQFLNETGEFEAVPAAVDEEYLLPSALDSFAAVVMWGHGRPISMDVQKAVVRQVESGTLGIVGLHSILVHAANPVLVSRLFGQTERYGWEDGVPLRYSPVGIDHSVIGVVEAFEIEDEAYYEPFGLVEGADVLLQVEVPNGGTRRPHIFNHATGRYELRELDVSGRISRAGWSYRVGHGRSVYLQPGHETYPTYYNPAVQRLIVRAVQWAASR